MGLTLKKKINTKIKKNIKFMTCKKMIIIFSSIISLF
jgi:hypothetical protein